MPQNTTEKHSRSFLKTLSYRLLSATADALVAYFFTHSVTLSAGIVILMNSYGIVLYYLHERVWAHVPWGSPQEKDTPST